MSALSKFMRDNSPSAIRRNRAEWYAWLASQQSIHSAHVGKVYARDFRVTPYRADGTLDYGRQYVSYRGRAG